jgi:hypothetical protein
LFGDSRPDLKLIIEECANCGSGLITATNSAHINNFVNSLVECSGITIDRKFEPIDILTKKTEG